MTSQQFQTNLSEKSEKSILSAEGFRAKLSQLRGIDEGLKIHEGLCSLKSQGLHLFSNLNIYSLRMLKDCSTTIKEIPLRSSSKRLMNWGMMWNGKYLTAKILEFHKTENECLLSDILEEQVDERYSLSEKTTQRLMGYKDNQQIPLQQDTEKQMGAGRILLKVNSRKVNQDCHENNRLSDGMRIRKLTPRECWRLQGFPDWTFDKASKVNSNSQLYKQAGNSVTVNVIYEIAKLLKEE